MDETTYFKEDQVPASDPFRAMTRGPSLSDRVAEHLTEAIVSRKLKPGDLLPSERELGGKFNVSRTVVREAVRSLAAHGLVRVTSRHGVEVNAFGPGDVAASMRLLVRGHEGLDYGKVHEVRTAVELQVAGLAAERADPEHLERLAQLCNDYQNSLDKRDLAAGSELDFQFHRELTRASGNVLLLAMLDSIADVLREVRIQSMADPHVAEEGLRAHRQILKCVLARNPEAARAAMAKHLAEAERVWRGENVAAKNKEHTPMTRRLGGKRAIVTGAGAGIGHGAAIKLAQEGTSAGVLDVKLITAEETAALITKAGGRAKCTEERRIDRART